MKNILSINLKKEAFYKKKWSWQFYGETFNYFFIKVWVLNLLTIKILNNPKCYLTIYLSSAREKIQKC